MATYNWGMRNGKIVLPEGEDIAPITVIFKRQLDFQPTYLEINEYGTAQFDYSSEIENEVPEEVKNHRTIRLSCPPKISSFKILEFFENDDNRILIDEIIGGMHREHIEGTLTGFINEKGQEAIEKLKTILKNMNEDIEYYREPEEFWPTFSDLMKDLEYANWNAIKLIELYNNQKDGTNGFFTKLDFHADDIISYINVMLKKLS